MVQLLALGAHASACATTTVPFGDSQTALPHEPSNHTPSTVAFVYSEAVPECVFSQYDRVVVQPTLVSPGVARRPGTVAYVSVGEVAGSDAQGIHDEWMLGHNNKWKSQVVDVRQAGYREHLVHQRVEPLVQAGFDGLFLDTLDSAEPWMTSTKAQREHEDSLVVLIETLARRFPGLEIYINRGFSVVDRVSKHVAGLVAESLFHRFDPSTGRYEATSADDQAWLLAKLTHARNSSGVPVIVIDYLDPNASESKRESYATQIARRGFVAWIGDGHLATVGLGMAADPSGAPHE